tara:strand:+ start:3519 stop:3917 length:399 start_codon:yes stop_codon:yes gene_type:complete
MDKNVPNDDLGEALRKCHKVVEDEKGVQMSIEARKKYGKPVIKRGIAEPVGTELEHIIPVRFLVAKMVDMYLWYNWRDREEIERFIEKTFYGVYKLKKIEHDIQEFDAEKLILEEFRESEKIKYFNEYTPKR